MKVTNIVLVLFAVCNALEANAVNSTSSNSVYPVILQVSKDSGLVTGEGELVDGNKIKSGDKVPEDINMIKRAGHYYFIGDSIAIKSVKLGDSLFYDAHYADHTYQFELPIGNNALLNQRICDDYKAELEALKDDEAGEPYDYKDIEFRKRYENEHLLTYTYGDELAYHYAAHGLYAYRGYTYNKHSAERFGWDCIDTGKKALRTRLYKMIYESDINDGDLLLGEWNASNFPLPETKPFIFNDTIYFEYQLYEVTAYAAGMQESFITIDEALKMGILTPKGKAFLKEVLEDRKKK